jgi:hypothetical protein
MPKYLGEKPVKIADTKFADFTPSDWAMMYIEMYGGIDGGHHKTWVLDQVARILKGASIKVRLASWEGGQTEYRFNVGSSAQYRAWVKEMKGSGNETYEYDVGIAP